MFYQLPPVGNPVCLRADDQQESSLQEFFSSYQQRYYASGTAALAAAMMAARRLKDSASPEVVLPAYGCPDLVSAAIFAGVKPVLVDLEADRPWMDLEQLPDCINSNTVAIIAANLFGISERLAQIRSIAEQAGAVLVEDSAQAFPGREESEIWGGDLVVLSFGRGKPVSLLGGGAILYRNTRLGDLVPEAGAQAGSNWRRRASVVLKAHLYNRLISPRLYWLPQGLPFLHLGETRYHPLAAIEAMDRVRLALLTANITAYKSDDMHVQNALTDMLEVVDTTATGLVDLPGICQVSRRRRLLRYPLLFDAPVRNELYQQLRRSGLGPSLMYPSALPGIPGLEKLLHGQGRFPAAESFAARILTLPTHIKVRDNDIAKMSQLLSTG